MDSILIEKIRMVTPFGFLISLMLVYMLGMTPDNLVKILPEFLRRRLWWKKFCYDTSIPMFWRAICVICVCLGCLVRSEYRNELPDRWVQHVNCIRRRYQERHQIFTGLFMLLVLVSGGGVCLSSLMIAQGSALTAFVGVLVLVCTTFTFLLALLVTSTRLTVELVLGRKA